MSQETDQLNQPSQGNGNDFENLYLALRKAEGWEYTDKEVARQPKNGITSRSAGRLIKHLKKKNKPLNILEIGCGSGWLAAKLAGIPNANVTAIDVISEEIEQAKRVFQKNNLQFLKATVFDQPVEGQTFDVIVFAGSIQFVPKARDVIKKALTMLSARGEIHVTDIPLYHDRQVMAAAQRARDRYETLNISQMAKHHHHYSMDIFREFNYRVLLDPRSFINKMKGEKYFWVKIYKQ